MSEPAAPWRWLVPVLLVAAALAAGILLVARSSDEDPVLRVEIPQGTAARVDRGRSPDLLEDVVTVTEGTTLVVENDDRRIHQVGPVTVAPGATAQATLDSAGTTRVPSTVNVGGQVTFVVRAG